MQNAEYLAALGVVQYRRRELQVQQIVSKGSEPLPTENNSVTHETVSTRVEPASDQSLTPVSENLKTDTSHINASPRIETVPETGQAPKEKMEFDLLVWKTDRLLVWEISSGQAEQAPAKHLLVNNILKALWPKDFKGTQMLQQAWPLPGVDASKASAKDWLGSMLSGHLQQSSNVPVWLMGEMAMELILGSSDEDDSLDGSRIKHPRMDLELFPGPSSQDMFDSPISKAQTWQLLRELRHG